MMLQKYHTNNSFKDIHLLSFKTAMNLMNHKKCLNCKFDYYDFVIISIKLMLYKIWLKIVSILTKKETDYHIK